MCRFIETIRIDGGVVRNLAYHERRLNDTRTHFWPESTGLQLTDFLPPIPENGRHRLRIVYGRCGIEEVTCTPYILRPVRSLALISANDIGYTYKSADREALNQLFAQRGSCDDILIVRQRQFTPVCHRIEKADGGVGRQIFHAYILFRKNAFVQ